MNKYLACVAKKYTKEKQSEVFEIECLTEYYIANQLEVLTGIKINGKDNYVDFVLIV